MTRSLPAVLLAVLGLSLAAACSDKEAVAVKPAPVLLTEEALGHYCNMGLLEHDGPKAQIHLKGMEHPVWFTQVRDAIAYTRLPEETHEPVAIYVNDMGRAQSWEQPGTDNWLDIDQAWLVIGSRRSGGMGAPEAIPFGAREQADAFALEHGGQVVRIGEVADAYVLAPIDTGLQNAQHGGSMK